MFSALHPYNNTLINCKEYREFALLNHYLKVNDAPSARCPVCERAMKVRAGHLKDDDHFYHNDSLFCPTKAISNKPYNKLPLVTRDAVSKKNNQIYAQENMGKIWVRLKEIIPFLDFLEFLSILDEAKKLNIYGCANLNPEFLPYIYVTLINFLPSKSYKNNENLSLFFL